MSMISGLGNSGSYARRDVFGGGSMARDSEEIPKKTVSNFRTTTRGFSMNKSSTKPFKDPDVWDPPPTV